MVYIWILWQLYSCCTENSKSSAWRCSLSSRFMRFQSYSCSYNYMSGVYTRSLRRQYYPWLVNKLISNFDWIYAHNYHYLSLKFETPFHPSLLPSFFTINYRLYQLYKDYQKKPTRFVLLFTEFFLHVPHVHLSILHLFHPLQCNVLDI